MKKKNTGKPGQNNTSFAEFVRWMYRRSKLRRRYSRDDVTGARRRQYLCGVGFLVLLTVVIASSITYTRLHFSHEQTQIALPDPPLSPVIANPALTPDSIGADVTVILGTEAPVTHTVTAAAVADILADLGCTYSDADIVTPSPDTVITDDTEIRVVYVTYEESEEIAPIPYGTVYEDIQTIPRGSTVRVSYGEDGVARQMQRRRYENGVLADTEVLSSVTVSEPIDEVLQRGIGGIVSGKHGSFRYSYYIDVTATAYGDYDEPRLTYSGTLAQAGVIAVDPTVIPLGTKVYVKGDYGDYGYCSADDIGSGIKGHHIDIFMECSREEMLQFGIRKMRVYILE